MRKGRGRIPRPKENIAVVAMKSGNHLQFIRTLRRQMRGLSDSSR